MKEGKGRERWMEKGTRCKGKNKMGREKRVSERVSEKERRREGETARVAR